MKSYAPEKQRKCFVVFIRGGRVRPNKCKAVFILMGNAKDLKNTPRFSYNAYFSRFLQTDQ